MADYKPTVRTVLNRERLHDVDLGLVKGLEWLAEEVLERTQIPYPQPPGHDHEGKYISYVDGKRVGGTTGKKPKSFKVRGRGVSVAVGFPFPARFKEMGTVRQAPSPFFAPAVVTAVGNRALVETAIKAGLDEYLSKRAAKLARGKGKSSAGRRYEKPAGDPFDFGEATAGQRASTTPFRRGDV